ncbi:MAG: metallophosphoesterase [Phycisphaerales bacterium]|nr:MAG: metallophosphoesterase [Phycisphaerales bacterium]
MVTAQSELTRRDFVKVAGAGAATWAWSPLTQPSRAAEDRGGFCFFLMADPQLFWGSKASWEKAIGYANRLKPDFAIVCGDMVNHAGNEEEVKAYLDGAAQLDKAIPLYHVCGNHDYDVSRPESLGW